jgi:hypothetical protein
VQSHPRRIANHQIETPCVQHVTGMHTPGEWQGATLAQTAKLGAKRTNPSAKRREPRALVRRDWGPLAEQIASAQGSEQVLSSRASGYAFRLGPRYGTRTLGALERECCRSLVGTRRARISLAEPRHLASPWLPPSLM